MTLRSTTRATYHVALDFWGCLRRFADGKAVNGYDDHMAGLLAEAGGKQAGRDLADALAEGKSRNEYLGPYESPGYFAEAGERLADRGLIDTDVTVMSGWLDASSLAGGSDGLGPTTIPLLSADEVDLVRQLLAERFPESSVTSDAPRLDVTEPAPDPTPRSGAGTPLTPGEAHKQALTRALNEDRGGRRP